MGSFKEISRRPGCHGSINWCPMDADIQESFGDEWERERGVWSQNTKSSVGT